MSCCPPGSWPALVADKDTTQKGSEIIIKDDLKAYYVPSETTSEKAVLIFYDIFGWTGGQIRSICVQFAEKGFHVFMPNFYRNEDGINSFGGLNFSKQPPFTPEGIDFIKANNKTRCLDDIQSMYKFIECNHKDIKSIGSLGFCWGAWLNMHQGQDGVVKAIASCHPSFYAESAFYGGNEIEELKKIKCPMLLNVAGNDQENTKPGKEVEQIFKDNNICIEQGSKKVTFFMT